MKEQAEHMETLETLPRGNLLPDVDFSSKSHCRMRVLATLIPRGISFGTRKHFASEKVRSFATNRNVMFMINTCSRLLVIPATEHGRAGALRGCDGP